MSKLVEEYLGFARGEGREQVRPTDLAPILESMRQRAERSGVELDIAMDRPVVLPLRPTAFHRCLGNLVDNAISFSPTGGRVAVLAHRKGAEIEIAVEDEGPGIAAENLERIFERFYTDRPQENFGQNSGLGLNISRQIVAAHGGRLYAENRTATGANANGSGGARFVTAA